LLYPSNTPAQNKDPWLETQAHGAGKQSSAHAAQAQFVSLETGLVDCLMSKHQSQHSETELSEHEPYLSTF